MEAEMGGSFSAASCVIRALCKEPCKNEMIAVQYCRALSAGNESKHSRKEGRCISLLSIPAKCRPEILVSLLHVLMLAEYINTLVALCWDRHVLDQSFFFIVFGLSKNGR
jgi:hypothetical protein